MNAYELADELQETEPYYSTDYKLFDKAAAMLRQQADRIAELEKDGKVCATCGGLVYDAVLPQIKELSDEEIVQISKTCDLNHVLGLIDFARAILKKASEK